MRYGGQSSDSSEKGRSPTDCNLSPQLHETLREYFVLVKEHGLEVEGHPRTIDEWYA
jgi:hypothetical protein